MVNVFEELGDNFVSRYLYIENFLLLFLGKVFDYIKALLQFLHDLWVWVTVGYLEYVDVMGYLKSVTGW